VAGEHRSGDHDRPIQVITMDRSARSRCSDPGDHDAPERADLAKGPAISGQDCRELVPCEEPLAGLLIERGEVVTVSYQADCRRGGTTRGVGRCEW